MSPFKQSIFAFKILFKELIKLKSSLCAEEEDFEEFLKELIQQLQSENIPNEKKSFEKVKSFAEEVPEKIQNEKYPTNLESDEDIAKMTNDVGLSTEEKPKNTVQSEKPQNGKNLTHLEEFWAEFDENSETPKTGDGNEKDNIADELFQVVQLENNTAEIVTTVSAWLDWLNS